MSGSLSDDPVFSALTNPTTSALLGAAQGFGSAAMPSRMPVPLGAAIGMGGAGALQGLGQGQQLQRENIANQQANIGLNWYKNMYGGNGTPGTMGVPQAGANGQYIVPPSTLASMVPMLVAQGKDPTGVLKMLESYATNGRALDPGGNIFSIPGGTGAIAAEAAAKAGGAKAGELPFVGPIAQATAAGTAAGELPYAGPKAAAVAAANSQFEPMTWHELAQDPNGLMPGQPGYQNTDVVRTGTRAQFRQSHPDSAPPTDPQNAGLAALSSISDPKTRMMTVNAMLAARLPVNAWAPFVAGVQHESGFNPGVADNKNTDGSYDVGLGQINSGNFGKLGLTETQLRDPQTNLAAAATMFGQSWQAANGNPAQAYAHYNTGSVNGTPTAGYLGDTLPRLAKWGYPGVPSNVDAAVGEQKTTLTPEQDAALKVKTAEAMPADLRAGGMRVNPPNPFTGAPGSEIKNPELREVTLKDGTKIFVHANPASPTAPAGTPGTAAPVLMQPPGQPNAAPVPVGNAVSPDTQEARDHLVTEFHGKDADSYVAAQNTQGWLNQIDHAADVMNHAGAAYQTGPFAATRLGLMNNINDATRSLGIGTAFDNNALASSEEMRKATTTAGFELSSHYEGHARQAAATIMNATSAVPGMSNSPQGLTLVSSGIHEGAQSAQDAHEYKMARYNGTDPYGINPAANGKTAGAGLETAETDFYKQFPASMYSTRAISTVQPVKMAAKSLDDFNSQAAKYLPGTAVIVNDQQPPRIVPARPNAPPIPAYIQQRFMRPQASNGG